MKLERKRNAARNMIWGYIGILVNSVLAFAFRTVVIKNLGIEYLGVSGLFTSILQVLSMTELGFGSAVVFSMYRPIAENDEPSICSLLGYYKRIYIAVGCVIVLSGLFLLPFLPKLVSGTIPEEINLYYIYLLFLLNSGISYFLFAYRGALFHAYQRNDIISKISTFIIAVKYIIEIIVIIFCKNYYLYLLIEITATICTSLLQYLYSKKMYPGIVPTASLSAVHKKEIRGNVSALVFHKIGSITLNSADNIVMSAFLGFAIVGIYSNYYYISSFLTKIIIMCFVSMTAGIGNSFITETKEKNKKDFEKVLFLNFWMVGWCSVCMVCLYQDFIKLWVGKEYMFNTLIMILFVIYFYIHCIRRTIIVFRDAAGMWRENKWQPIVSSCFNLIVNIILVKTIGVAGILISSIMSMVIIDIPWEAVAFCRKVEMPTMRYIRLLAKYFLATSLNCLLMYAFTCSFKMPIIINLLTKGCLCIILPNIVFWFLFRKADEYQYFISLLKQFKNKEARL